MDHLSPTFLEELIKLSFKNKQVLETLTRYLKFSYVPVEQKAHRRIFKALIDYYTELTELPTIGIISQRARGEGVDELLQKIAQVREPEPEELLQQFEVYIKRCMFQEVYEHTAELYNSDKQEEAIQYQSEEAAKIVSFSIFTDISLLSDVFGEYEERSIQRSSEDAEMKKKIPFGIERLDAATNGGIDALSGDTCCLMARSGAGKTKFLRHIGIEAARRGFHVLHFQAEGTKQECLDGYDEAWTGLLRDELYKGDLSVEMQAKLEMTLRKMKLKGSIKVRAFEQFGAASMADVRQTIFDYQRLNRMLPDVVLVDYLELFDPGDNRKYFASTDSEKMRREMTARKFKNICLEFKIAGFTATQANDIKPSDYNNKDFVLTRHNVSAAKGLPDSFSAFLSLNVTREEYEQEIARIHVDKLRKAKGGETFEVATNYKRNRFYNRARTRNLEFNDTERKDDTSV
jgi:replicative DNA helicase